MLVSLSARAAEGPEDLVALLEACHQRIRHFTALAHDAATREEAPPEHVTEACAGVARYFREAFPLHVADEEESIAPRMLGFSPAVDLALDEMAEQHRVHAPMLDAMLERVADVAKAPHDRAARRALAIASQAVHVELARHLAMEEAILFPAMREHLDRETQERIIEELRGRRT